MRITRELENQYHKLDSSLWFRPTLIAIGSAILAFITVEFDRVFDVDRVFFLRAGIDDARAILSSVTSSMLTVTTVTFSIIMVALVLASQQFSPRIIRNVMRDTPSQYVLGTFIGTFIYSLLVLGQINDQAALIFVPILSLATSILLTLLSIVAFIYFVHHIAETIQASVLIARAAERTIDVLDRRFPETLGHAMEHIPAPPTPSTPSTTIHNPKGGYIQAIDPVPLLALAQRFDVVVYMDRAVGDFVPTGNPLLHMFPQRQLDRDAIAEFQDVFEFGLERTLFDDVLFGIRQLVDIALKAISPAVNDPSTAINAIDLLSDVLAQAIRRPEQSPCRYDEFDQLRVVANTITFRQMLGTAINQIRQYAKSEIAVTARLLVLLNEVALASNDQERRAMLWEQACIITRGADQGISDPYDRAYINEHLQTLANTLAISAAQRITLTVG
ncbi:DUF2254 domain-containing protein [Herpetosiphon giganteus]|uniref:DUF2254 domain-containing protein n=1 Tax=Herpetosiphon giganteus TaxID=2029754 RepID=UPI001959F476|nr:DUF2254 domain-containing protein [Herpetosiphon giganteus]MBM7846130.1 putative membrane protein [Herpetosiphon giganteus]